MPWRGVAAPNKTSHCIERSERSESSMPRSSPTFHDICQRLHRIIIIHRPSLQTVPAEPGVYRVRNGISARWSVDMTAPKPACRRLFVRDLGRNETIGTCEAYVLALWPTRKTVQSPLTVSVIIDRFSQGNVGK